MINEVKLSGEDWLFFTHHEIFILKSSNMIFFPFSVIFAILSIHGNIEILQNVDTWKYLRRRRVASFSSLADLLAILFFFFFFPPQTQQQQRKDFIAKEVARKKVTKTDIKNPQVIWSVGKVCQKYCNCIYDAKIFWCLWYLPLCLGCQRNYIGLITSFL